MAQYNPYGQQYYQAAASGSSPSTQSPAYQTGQSAAYSPQQQQQYYAGQQYGAAAAATGYAAYGQQGQYPGATSTTPAAPYPAYGFPAARVQVSAPIPSSDQGSIWMGDVEPWMDENFLYSLYAHTGEQFSVKLIKDKNTGQNANFCFVNFVNPMAAQKVIENFNGQPIPNTNKVFRLNWAAYGMGDKSRKPGAPVTVDMRGRMLGKAENDCSLFVGDLAQDVTDYYMLTTFQYYYPSCYSAKVVMDPKTNLSKGYGFVYFTDDAEKLRALNEMQGYYLSYRPIRINLATKKGEAKPGSFVPGAFGSGGPIHSLSSPPSDLLNADPSVTTVFVGGLDHTITPEHLNEVFSPFGEIRALKVPYGKTVAFIEFADHMCALKALSTLGHPNLGTVYVNNVPLKISWGKPAKPLPPGAVTTPPAGTVAGQPWPKPMHHLQNAQRPAYDPSYEQYQQQGYQPENPDYQSYQQQQGEQQNHQEEAQNYQETSTEEKEQKEVQNGEEKPTEVAITNEEANLAPSIEEQDSEEKRKFDEVEEEEQSPKKKRKIDLNEETNKKEEEPVVEKESEENKDEKESTEQTSS